MAEAHLLGLSDDEREELMERAGNETGRRLHAAASALLAAVDAGGSPSTSRRRWWPWRR